MRKTIIFSLIAMLIVACSVSMKNRTSSSQLIIPAGSFEDTLRFLYSLPPEKWPAPFIDSGVQWKELGIIPQSPLTPHLDSLKHLIALGKTLFFDPRLSGSNQISCATCHMPELSWSDGKQRSIGHDMQVNKRNSPTILNTWFYKHLFWDGRSNSLEDQAFSPINSETEMNSDMADMIRKLRRVEGYKPLFKAAYGNEEISPETVTDALAVFERTLTSGKADFDNFLSGEKDAMSDAALRGLHLFRTKARCMNCHNGPLLSDDQFHNTGLTNYQREHEDLGRYKVTHKAGDVGRFRTPSLRDVLRTRPWMHNGMFDNIDTIINMYSAGMPQQKSGPANDSLYPKIDRLIKRLDLTKGEKQDIIAFLNAITSEPYKITRPELPKP
ncbi:MAG TPA: cytochrome c peroxidase [Chitinophagaceae bacterium]|jgi:cytochrome c peroxidase|nr:cytochrome c peroxidase [Chitinophagaceae bacterium]